jgi:hypothetical protein
MKGEKRTLLLGEEFADRLATGEDILDRGVGDRTFFMLPEQTNPSGMTSSSIENADEARIFGLTSAGVIGRSLITESAGLS